MDLSLYEDSLRTGKQDAKERLSPYCDFICYRSSVTPGIELSMLVKKPAKPSYALFTTHGWHQSISPFKHMDEPEKGLEYLFIQVDMRGRAFSQGKPDCNALELMDVYDAVKIVRERYGDFLLDSDVIYFDAGSGGGGNAFAIAGKFPDLFASVNALYGISDYAKWYREDSVGEFRDEMDVWIGFPPEQNEDAYRARSGLYLAKNLLSPMYICHGETDERVPSSHSRLYFGAALAAGKGNLVKYFEMEGVGDRNHTGKATPEQMERLRAEREQNRKDHRRPVELPEKGELAVGGYIVTKKFMVMLGDMGVMARIRYDLSSKEIACIGEKPRCGYKITWF